AAKRVHSSIEVTGMRRVLLLGTLPSRESLKESFAGSAFAFAGEARTLSEAYRQLGARKAEEERAHIILTHVEGCPGGGEGEALPRIRRDWPKVKVVVLGDAPSLGALWAAYPTAVAGYLLHDMPRAALLHAVDLIMLGQQIFPP